MPVDRKQWAVMNISLELLICLLVGETQDGLLTTGFFLNLCDMILLFTLQTSSQK